MTSGMLAALAVLVLACGRRPPPRRDRRRRTPRRRRPAAPAAADWARYLDAVAASVRGGTAIRAAATDALRELGVQGEAVHAPLDLDTLDRRAVHHADEAVVVHALVTATRLGGATAATVQTGATLLRERAAVRAEAAAHAAQARLSARVLTIVPLGFAAWSATASHTYRRALATPAGVTSAALGVAANLAGWWWMRHIVRRATT